MKKVPLVYVIVFSLVILAVATWVLPGGEYERRQEQEGETTREMDCSRREEVLAQQQQHSTFTARHAAVMSLLGLGIVGMILCVVLLEWYITELAVLFLAMGIAAGLVSGMNANAIAKSFVAGAKNIGGAGQGSREAPTRE